MSERRVRLYQPAKSAQQSGRRKTRQWIVEYEPVARKEADALIGWVGSDDTLQQIRLTFPTKEAAIDYCKRNALTFVISEPHQRQVRPKSYAENFTRPRLD